MAKDILKLKYANNSCPHCKGTGYLPNPPNVGFVLHVGDIVEDHCGLRVRVDRVWEEDPTTGWGTTLNAPSYYQFGDHSNHRIETNNLHYIESMWTRVR